MEEIPLGRRRARAGIYRPPKSTGYPDQKSLEPATNSMSTGVNKLQLQNSLSAGKQRREPDPLSRRLEYSPEEGARHTEQSILKTEPFHKSVVHQKLRAEMPLTLERREPASLRIMKLSDKAIILTKPPPFAAAHDIYALTNRQVPAKGQTMVATGIAI